MTSAEASPEEIAIRRRALELLGEHWEELSRRLAGWLGQAYRDDDSLPGEVALVMMRRYADGNGALVHHLRRNPHSDPDDDKSQLFYDAKLVSREVVVVATGERAKASFHTALLEGDEFEFADEAAVWSAETEADAVAFNTGSPEQFMESIGDLLSRGEATWNSVSDDGLIDRASWTEDQKWTAIGMMWDFSVAQIAVLRQVKARTPGSFVANEAATRQMMGTVRRKGRILLGAFSPVALREHALLGRGRTAATRGETRSPAEIGGTPVEPGRTTPDATRAEQGEPPSLYWVTDLPRDDKALRRRVLFVNDTYRLVTRFTAAPPALGDPAETSLIGCGYVNKTVQFEITAEGAGVRRAIDGAGEVPFLNRVTSEPSVCSEGGTEPFAVDMRADRVGRARIEVQVSADGVPLDNAHLLEFTVVDPGAPQPYAQLPASGAAAPTTLLGTPSPAEVPIVHLKAGRTDPEGRVEFTWPGFGHEDVNFVSVNAERDLDVALRDARNALNALARSYSKCGPGPVDPLELADPDAAYLEAARIGYRLHRALFGKLGDGRAPAATRDSAERIANLGRSGPVAQVGRRMLVQTPCAPFPWGLVYDGGYLDNAAEPATANDVEALGFWGYRFTVDRMVVRHSFKVLDAALGHDVFSACTVVNAAIPPPVLDDRGRLTIVPEALRRPDPITSAVAFRAWMQEASEGSTDLVYFYCHAEPAQNVSDLGFFVNRASQSQARLILDQSSAGVVTVADMEEGRPPAGSPIVFLIACAGGQGDISFASPFASVFIRSWDGRSLVASDAEVPATFGHAFAARVVTDFLTQPKPIGQCLADASRRLLEARNPFGLFFGLHGQPEVFRRRPA